MAAMYDATGIDLDGISKITAEINHFQAAVNNAVKSATNVESSVLENAMKGPNVEAQYRAAANAVYEASRNIVTKLSQFQSILDKQVRNAYNNNAQAVAKQSFSRATSIK